ncbi:inverted formin-2-like [Dioscorea cayenensis subsp. rotundata]|uniref:Inverted formin-2-like n=1 Tax=Dioscorea cayennensis subsp. rotundata TaxID=55577 RepID=A0AB40AN09_DIOCR|nr:inverted formin-2-like [Dioscorea cayenensis subsp. rotundata]
MKGDHQLQRLVFLLLFTACFSIASSTTEKHEEETPVVPGDMKCTCNPCGCGGEVIPPPPPPPSPPPPSPPKGTSCSPPPPPPSPPPPSPPKGTSCSPPPPPPPPAQTWYVIGTPGVLYPLDPQYYPSQACRSSHAWLPHVFLLIVSFIFLEEFNLLLL